jgi:hypothetical protein
MKIWIDLRFLWNDVYSRFASQMVQFLIKKENNDYIIYTNSSINWFNKENVTIKKVNIKNWSLEEQIKFKKILKNDKNNLVIFFNHFKPIFYKWQYITFVWSLKDIYYMNFSSYFEKYKYLFLMWKNFKKSHKIICFDENTRDELIEKFDIPEIKIETISWFFPEIEENKDNFNEKLNINIKAKYWVTNDFFIYSGWDWIEKNYEKLISVFARLKDEWKNIDLVFLWHNISTNLNLRLLILETKMQKNVHFLWAIPFKDKEYLYPESLWTIFPSFYEPFPFKLGEPLMFWSKIIASDFKSIKNIFSDKVDNFSSISLNSIFSAVENFLKNNGQNKEIDYKDILDKYNKENTCKQLIEIIK